MKSQTNNDAVTNSIRRDCFLDIQYCLHLYNNLKLAENDKFAKVRTYFDVLNKNFINYCELISSSHISATKKMIPHFGRHSTNHINLENLSGLVTNYGLQQHGIGT